MIGLGGVGMNGGATGDGATLGSVGKGVIGGGALGRTIPGVGANVLFVPAFTKLAVLARVAAVARIAIDFIIFDIDIKISMGLG